MVALEGSRVHCIKRLVSGLPLEKGWEHQALLAEVRCGLNGSGLWIVLMVEAAFDSGRGASDLLKIDPDIYW